METYYPGLTRTDEYEAPAHDRSEAANVGKAERIGSLVAGGGLAIAGLRRIDSISGVALALLGGGLIYRGATGRCQLYRALGINTAARNPATGVPAQYGTRVEASIAIQRPRQVVFCFWRELENLPAFMSHLESVEAIDAFTSHWVAKGPFGTQLEWDAEIINEVENELIAWRSLPGSEVDTAGSVHFHALPEGGTEVRVALKYNPPGGQLSIGVARMFGSSAQRDIEEDLAALKQVLESGQRSPDFDRPSTGAAAAPASEAERRAAQALCHCQDEVDEASQESFPASDPPAWTMTRP